MPAVDVPQLQLCGVVDVSVIMQRQVFRVSGRWSMYLLCRSSFGASRATDHGRNRDGSEVPQLQFCGYGRPCDHEATWSSDFEQCWLWRR